MSISKIFDNRDYSLLVDSISLLDSLKKLDNIGEVYLFDEKFSDATSSTRTDIGNFVFLCTRWIPFVRFREFRNTRVLLLPQVAFATDENTSIYSVENLLNSDFDYAVSQHHEWYSILAEASQPLCFADKEDSYLTCHLSESIELSTIDDITLEIDDPRSVAEYFEIALENRCNETNSFTVNGCFEIQGVLMAKGVDFNLINYDVCFAKDLVELVSNSSSTRIFIQNNRITSILIDGTEYLSCFIDLIGEDKVRLPNVTEFAIGLNYRIRDGVKWCFNSQLNEGIQGLHLGIGDGQTGFHIDLINPNIEFIGYS